MFGVGVYVSQGDGGWGLVSPGKEEFQIVGVKDVGQGVGAPAAEPLAEALNFG